MPRLNFASPRLRLFGVAALISASIAMGALPDPTATPRIFNAQELSQGYTNFSVLALPKDPAADDALAQLESAEGFIVRRRYRHVGFLRELQLPSGLSVRAARAQLEATGRYQFVEYNQIRQTALAPNDPAYTNGSQWHLNNNGIGGVAGADIEAVAGWNIRTDASSVIVAVIDSGLRLTHQDIAPNLWTNPNEIAANGKDDDRNGYFDDVHGINARSTGVSAGSLADESPSGHGTHVAGLIGAAGNNGVGTSGVAWKVQLMPLKFLGGTDGTGSVADAVQCIDYAIAMGAKVINASYGAINDDITYSLAEYEAIRRAAAADIVVVAAAGNDGANLDRYRTYPASFPLENMITVGNSTRLEDPATSSNYGSGAIDLFAPGSEMLSTGTDDDTATRMLTGTSMSAPVVSGIVALLRAQYPQDNYRQIINRLLRGVEQIAAYRGRALTGGRASLLGALSATNNRPFNDDFATRATLVGDTVAARGSNRGAQAEAGEPSLAGLSGGPSIWFTWTAAASGTVTLDTLNSPGDTHLAVFTGTSLVSLTAVAANDNATDGQLTSRLNFDAVAGTAYQIAVSTTPETAGLVMLYLSSASANDNFAAATPLSGDAPMLTASNLVATKETGERTHAGTAQGKSLWYFWTAPTSGQVQISAYSEETDVIVSVYTGSKVDQLSLVAEDDDSGPDDMNPAAVASFAAVAGTTYHIAVDSAAAPGGEFTLSLTQALWQFTTGSIYDPVPTVTNSPAVGRDGTVYVASSDSYFYAIAPDGTQRWRFETYGSIDTSAAAVTADGTIIFGAYDGIAYALDPAGEVRWVNSPSQSPIGAPVAVAPDGSSYFKSVNGELAKLDADGNIDWTYPTTGDTSYSGPTVAPDGTVYMPGNDGAIHALTAGGQLLWRRMPTGPDGEDASGIFTSPSLDAAGNIYAATSNGTVFCLRPNGDTRWSVHTPGAGENVTSSLALADGHAYFATYGAFLYALDQTDGSIVWKSSIEAQARASSPAVAEDGSIFVGSYANKLFRFSKDGELLASWAAGNWFRSSPVLANGRLYVGNGDGKIYAFDLNGIGPAGRDRADWAQHRGGAFRLGRTTIDPTGQVIAPDPTDPGRLVNLSVRNRTRPAEGALIAGFVLGGSQSKPLVIRGIGPTLSNFGVADAVNATLLRAFGSANSNDPLASNQGWSAASGDGNEAGAFALPAGSADSVLKPNLAAGAYTAQVTPVVGGEPGTALIEVYDAARGQLDPPLVNLSARTALTAGGDVIAGFVLEGTTPRSVLIRAVGPGLTPFGVSDTVSNPNLTLYQGSNVVLANDDWAGTPLLTETAKSIGAFPLDAESADAVVLATLPPGAYTARVSAPAGEGGIVLVEVYLLPN